MVEPSQPILSGLQLEHESVTEYHLPHKSPLQNLGHASQAIPLEKLLAQAHSLRLLER